MTLRQQLMAAALIGTSQGLRLEPAGSVLDALAGKLVQRAPARGFLDAIALAIPYEEAGAIPPQAPKSSAPAPPDPRPRCGSIAGGHLLAILEDRRQLLPEWLAIARDLGVRPAEEFVPALLDAATADRGLREAVRIATGPLGSWLALFRPEWRWAGSAARETLNWETGSLDERIAWLREIRTADPTAARGLVEKTWQSESADAKRQLLAVLAAGASLDDEAFLESALDDRGPVVRRLAAERLACIAGSKLRQRMAERLKERVRVPEQGQLGRTKAIDIVPFETLDPSMARDGIEKKPPAGTKLGERAWWTMQALSCIDPMHWVRETGMTPDRLLEGAAKGQWSELLIGGWRTAAIRERAVEWLRAFAAAANPDDGETVAVFEAMPPQEREPAMAALLKKDAKAWLAETPALCSHPWSERFTETFVSMADRNRPDPAEPLAYRMKALLREAAHLASPAADACPSDEVFAEFTDVLSFRRRMREALENELENR